MAYEGKITYRSCKECSTKFPVTRKDRQFCLQKCATKYGVRKIREAKKVKIKKFVKRKKRNAAKVRSRVK